jgi:Hypothetical glycosyl hydrolase 6
MTATAREISDLVEGVPWWDRVQRWGQTNLVEADAARFDVEWWREQWARTKTQGIFVNCGGIAAYYPTAVPNHKMAPGIENRDLFGDVLAAARGDGLAVMARMDSNRGDAEVFAAHPEWFCFDQDGEPYRRGDKYATCISSAYYDEFIPSIMREVIDLYQPEGFADNGWAGIDRTNICYCQNCERRFYDWSRLKLPTQTDWQDETYHQWIEWSYARRTELWQQNNAVTRGAGGRDCLWLGMLHGQLVHNAAVFQDSKELVKHTPVVLLDHQRRHGDEGFEQNAEVGKRLHEIAGWSTPVLECTAMYDMGYPAFRLSSMPRAEVELWMTEGWAGGTRPWWHHIGSVHDDRRQYETAVNLSAWHADNEAVLRDRVPVANVGVVWSQRNLDFYGQEDGPNTVIAPYAGVNRVLVESNIPFVPVNVDDIANTDVDVLVLPDLAVMTSQQCDAVRRFVDSGGSIVATGATSSRDEYGRVRQDFALADLLGAHLTTRVHGATTPPSKSIEVWERHSYLRIESAAGNRHPVVSGLEGTSTISFGGYLPEVTPEPGVGVQLTFVPQFPIFPPETSWMRVPQTDIPALLTRELDNGARIVFIPADLDRCSFREEQPDHATILASAIEWALQDNRSLTVESAAPVNSNVYTRADGLVVHLNNLVYMSKVPGRQSSIIPVGPVKVRVRTPRAAAVREVCRLVETRPIPFEVDDSWVSFTVDTLAAHEVVHLQMESDDV